MEIIIRKRFIDMFQNKWLGGGEYLSLLEYLRFAQQIDFVSPNIKEGELIVVSVLESPSFHYSIPQDTTVENYAEMLEEFKEGFLTHLLENCDKDDLIDLNNALLEII